MGSGMMQQEGSTAMTDQLYTTHDISRLLQVDPSTVSKWIDRGILMAFRTPGGHRRVRSADLRTFLIAHQMPVPEELGSGTVRLLVVDDERAVLDAVKRAFKPFSAQVELQTTTSGVEALLLVSEQKPHGMIIDLNMPDIDGLEVCRRIRARKQMEGVRLITMTSMHTADVVEQSKQAGALACLAKPLDVQQVLELFRVPISLGAKR
ncbi:response regulator [Myxococcus sp. MISCRS1]|jgi:excisionase family DNA binding protein|uniref:response regulator n=1 Tax=Myxococcus TaxID=32 RepID=UPI0006282A70|nr:MULTISPECIES: response regulator [Myxococcus]MBZ4397701.1 response regulator [Myxococcus sp. AS-1-15]MBZ4407733.1 response regulator [Myxococcus sp. XM-1-1-1]MCK8497742.1 response regulator [Myxococcus fulvus]MCP3058505.1 response regulator [Myxococcus guangdongensis]MCY0998437.1 response regulator [Myxococcus sp. MISCRS1]